MRTRILHAAGAPTVRRVGPDGPGRLDPGGGGARGQDTPVVLGRYRLRRRLGTGAFATVWLAHDERLDRQVAVKILPRERVVGGRFEREARAAARLAHPGIVTLYEAAVDDEGAYLVSELVRGATLEELLAAGRLSDRDLIRIGMALCDALAHAHAQGVIHRDVKPSNVLVPDRHTTSAQLARLTDFGVARVIGGDSLTRTGDVIGTAAYMAPEQAQGLPAGAASDLFSLALVLYEALSGVNPLRSGIAGGRARRAGLHLPPLRRQRRDLPRELGRAIDLALRPRPGERGTIEELRSALAASVGRVGDEPGVVADPLPARTLRMEDDAGDKEAQPAPAVHATAWLRRALAGLAAAALCLWLARRAPAAVPSPPALAACLAGLLVAAAPRAGWLAPGLAALNLATAWPALAGLTGRARRRAALGAGGAVWTVLWTHGISHAVLAAGTLATCGVWALAALTLPWTRSRRWPALEIVRLTLWAVALGVATLAASHLGGPAPNASPFLGAFAGALVTFVTRRLARRAKGHQIGERSRADRVPSD